MSNHLAKKQLGKSLRKNRVRSKISGTATRPRLTVTISNLHVSAQLIDDTSSKTLAYATTVGTKTKGTTTEKAVIVGKDIAAKAKKAKITKVVFDRNGRAYAGRLKALADAVRQEGVEV
ncbi:MAG: 50S ribosomal protein L18 [Candidatus Saccharibacteria bacterium]|nr:50S ribosomal protein L18 [Candidatus Saccharibacteria bacterium]